MAAIEVVISRVRAAENRVNILTRESRNKDYDQLRQKAQGILVGELSDINVTPDDAYEAVVTYLSEHEYDENPELGNDACEVVTFLEYYVDF